MKNVREKTFSKEKCEKKFSLAHILEKIYYLCTHQTNII